jgi:EAL domain-containing protein (putative c-di-GMP-specific phosphodiesterase class I)/CheY-like chemotaxis protein
VLIADDQEVVREALADMLASDPTLEVVGCAADADEAILMALDLQPDVALLDVRMPGGGMRAAEGIMKGATATRVIALSAHSDRESVFSMLQAGASGYLVKGATRDEILAGVHQAAGAQAVLSAEVTGDVVGGLAEKLREERQAKARMLERRQLLLDAINAGAPRIVFQPIVDLKERAVRGYEALARFDLQPQRAPDHWFAEAAEVGLLRELEMAAIRNAMAAAESLDGAAYLSLNISPSTLLAGDMTGVQLGPPRAYLVEVTEHAVVRDYDVLAASIRDLRARGMRLAVDDAGAGYASLRHILRLAPDVIKLDISLTRGIDGDEALQAMAAAFIAFASRTRTTIIAEGIETEAELDTLVGLGVHMGQGYLLGKPSDDGRLEPWTRPAEAGSLQRVDVDQETPPVG